MELFQKKTHKEITQLETTITETKVVVATQVDQLSQRDAELEIRG